MMENEQHTSMDEIFGSDTPAEPVAQEVAETSIPRDEHGRFAPRDTGETVEAEPEPSGTPPQEPEAQHIPIAALKDERQKRQQLEAQLQQAMEYIQSVQQPVQQQPQQAEVPDMFADPEGFQAYMLEMAEQRVLQRLAPQLQQQQVMSRAEMSEFAARQKFPDYDATLEHVKAAVAENPFLAQQIAQAPDPAGHAYQVGKKYQEAKQYGTAAPSRDEIKAQMREEIMAELGLNRPQVPTTLAGDRSVGARSVPGFAGPTPLDDIFSR